MECKVSVIGAGSVAFSLNLVKGLVQTEGLKGSTVALVDVDKKRLDTVTGLAKRLVKEKGGDLQFEPTQDRKQALKDADFVINCAEPGGHQTWLKETKISRKHGLNRTRDIGFMYYRNMPLMFSIAKDVEEICPDAWLINYAHPTIIGTWALHLYSKVKNVGLCHATQIGFRKILGYLHMKEEEADYQAYGMNHCTFLTHFYYKGEDAYPLLDEYLGKRAPKEWESEEFHWRQDWEWWGTSRFLSGERIPELFPDGPMKAEVYKIYGLYPLPSDTEIRGFFPEFTADEKTIKKYKLIEDFGERYIAMAAKEYEDIEKVASDPSLSVSESFPWTSTETAIPIMDSIANNEERVFVVNIPNRGCMPSLPDDAVVEIPALVSRKGIQGIHVGDLPKGITQVFKHHISIDELRLQAAVFGDKKALLQAFIADPHIDSVDQAEAIMNDLYKLSERWLTQFKQPLA